MKSPRKSRFALLAAMLVAATALGDEGEVRRAVQGKLPGVESVKKQPFGLYEVVTRGADGPQIYYTDEQASVIIAGQVFDSKTGTSLTEERLRKISTIKWQSLPFNLAVTTVRGNGRRKIAIFSDPNCPYCKKFEKDLAGLDDITVHVFLYPVIKPQSVQQTKAVWCSKDRSKAWNDLMQRDVQPSA